MIELREHQLRVVNKMSNHQNKVTNKFKTSTNMAVNLKVQLNQDDQTSSKSKHVQTNNEHASILMFEALPQKKRKVENGD